MRSFCFYLVFEKLKQFVVKQLLRGRSSFVIGLAFRLIFCQSQSEVAYKSVTYKKSCVAYKSVTYKKTCVSYKSVSYKKACVAYKNVTYKCVLLIKLLHIKRCVVASTNIRNSQDFFFLKVLF